MIPRYSLPEISKIWSDEYRFDLWRDIEVLYCQGLAENGFIPKKAAREIKRKAGYSIPRVLQIEKKTRHDVIAFLTDMSDRIGPDGRYLHMGMTSSDLLDTTLACQMRAAGMVILRKLGRLQWRRRLGRWLPAREIERFTTRSETVTEFTVLHTLTRSF